MSLDPLIDEWLRLDKNSDTRDEVLRLREAGNIQELEKRMRHRIEFGTAGLRGKMESGWSRMNDLIVIQTSQGLCQYILKNTKVNEASVVIGHDHRHNSVKWAELTAMAFISRGVKVFLLQGLVHTPMVPFSVKRLGASAGVMITASHNPKRDNGYKVYWNNAVQIINPHDKGIAQAIMENLEPTIWHDPRLLSSPLLIDRTTELIDEYFKCLLELSFTKETNTLTAVNFVNTSMHGVGDAFVNKAFNVFGFPEQSLVVVEEQRKPDPDFSTVKFPNPEEKGALDLAFTTANRERLQYILAQDPDADRFSAAERGPNGTWVHFTGDQLGTIFAARILEIYKKSGKPIEKLAMVASTVSSKMIEAMAKVEGFKFTECLTGFKFIGNTALSLVAQGYEVPFGYEEAIGFMFGDHIRDKDGVAASMIFAELVVSLQDEHRTVQSYLSDLYDKYGYFETSNSYFICNDPPTTEAIFSRLREFDESSASQSYPSTIAGLPLTRVVDLTTGYDSGNPPSYEPVLPLSSGQMIQFRAGKRDEGRLEIVLTLRTSGTEPKIKYYLEGSGQERAQVKSLLSTVVSELGNHWLEAPKYGLKHG